MKVGDFTAKISTKMVLENGCFCTLGGPLAVEITSVGESQRLQGWVSAVVKWHLETESR